MICSECKQECTDGKCREIGVGVGKFKRKWWVCPACAKTELDMSKATELTPHWLETIKETALKQRWGDGTTVTEASVLEQ